MAAPWRWTKGAAPCAVQAARTVLNGGDEETYRKATRLVPTQPGCRRDSPPAFGAKGKEGIGRALFCTAAGQTIMILHAFIKKTQKTPQRDLELARRRLREVRRDTP